MPVAAPPSVLLFGLPPEHLHDFFFLGKPLRTGIQPSLRRVGVPMVDLISLEIGLLFLVQLGISLRCVFEILPGAFDADGQLL